MTVNARNRTTKNKDIVLVAVIGLAIGIFAFQAWATHQFFTEPYTGGNDYYSRWYGARALFIEGRDPYSLEVTEEIQPVIGINPTSIGRGGFAYPLHVVFLFWPLVYLSFPLALAIWMTIVQWLLIATVIMLIKINEWRLSPLAVAGIIVCSLLLYPVSRSIIMGQFTVHVAFFLAGSLFLLRRGHDGWAGALLAATSIKPQMIIVTAPWIVIWAVANRRWRFIKGLLIAGGVMLVASLALFPKWPLSFIEDVQRYSKVSGGRNPLTVTLDQVLPGAGDPTRITVMVVLLLITCYFCWRGLSGDQDSFTRATYLTIIVGQVVVFQTGSTNQVLLIILLIGWLSQLHQRKNGPVLAAGLLVALVFLPWLLFMSTLDGKTESDLMFVPLPLIALLVLGAQSFRNRFRSQMA
jgi:hypothetical protein